MARQEIKQLITTVMSDIKRQVRSAVGAMGQIELWPEVQVGVG